MALEEYQVADLAARKALLEQTLAIDVAYRVYRDLDLQQRRDVATATLANDIILRKFREDDMSFRKQAQEDNKASAAACVASQTKLAEVQVLVADRLLKPTELHAMEITLRQAEVKAMTALADAVAKLAAAQPVPVPMPVPVPGPVPVPMPPILLPPTKPPSDLTFEQRTATALETLAKNHQQLTEIVWNYLKKVTPV